MWKDELSTPMLPFGTSDLPCCYRRQWYSCHGLSCGFHFCTLQPSIHIIQLSLDASERTLAYVFAKYPISKMPLVPSTNLMFNMPIFQYGLKDRSMGKKEERQLPENESKAVFPPAFHRDRTNHSRCVQAINSHLWSDTTVQASTRVTAQRRPNSLVVFVHYE
ncbi:hypothetical protein MRX96_058207 [Rhipicephalus microplus]